MARQLIGFVSLGCAARRAWSTQTGSQPTAVDGAYLIRQRTLVNDVEATGVGLHSGAQVRLTIRPAHADTGIVFRRTDLCPSATVKAAAANVVDTQFATTIGVGDVRVSTVEHLMAAFAGFGIDNACVDVSGPELPIMDGSAAPYVALIEDAGIEKQSRPKRFLKIVREVAYTDGAASARLSPYDDGFRVEYTMNYDHPFLRDQCQHAAVDVSTSAFVRDVSRARTFGFLAELEELRARNLVRGGSLDNAIVVDDDGILNTDGLRYDDEFVKHKILDAIGDLYLCGHPIIGAFTGHQSGHGSNNALLRLLLADPSAFVSTTCESTDLAADKAAPVNGAAASSTQAQRNKITQQFAMQTAAAVVSTNGAAARSTRA